LRRALIRTLIAASLFLAAAALGYYVSSSLGQEMIRREIETQLSRLMEGPVKVERARLMVHLGFKLEAERVEVYPDPSGPRLTARRVDAEIDVLSLLLGRFRLQTLQVDDLLMRIERDAEGRWSPHPLAALQDEETSPSDPERHLALLRAFESVAEALLARPLVANLVVVRNARVDLVDWLPGGPRQPPLTLSLQSARGSWDHRWFSSANELSLRGDLVDDRQRRTRVEAEGQRLESDQLHWSLAATDLPMDIFRPYARLIDAENLTGRLSGVVSFETTGTDSDSVELDWVLWDVGTAVPWRKASAQLSGKRVGLNARLELRPARLRLAEAKLSTGDESLSIRGFIERPLRESSRTRLSAEITGMDFDDLRAAAAALPPVDRETVRRILKPFHGGTIRRVSASAGARLSTWRDLLERERPTLPPGFLVGAQVENARLVLGDDPDDAISKLDAEIEWSGDRLQTREMTGVWEDEPLPKLALSIQGVSNLFATPESERQVESGATPLPGLPVIAEWLRSLSPEEEDGGEPIVWPRLHLELRKLQHPAVFWPLRDVKAVLTLRPDGTDLAIPSGLWAGAPMRGEAFLSPRPNRSFNVSFIVSPPDPNRASAPKPPESQAEKALWLQGRFEAEPVAEGPLAYETLQGHIQAVGDEASLTGVRAELVGGGRLEGKVQLDLGHPDRIPAELSAQLFDGDVARLSPLLGLDEGTATGTVKLAGSLHGELVPGEEPLTALSGNLSLDARDGEIRRRMPVVVAMAQATEGFNPFAARDAVKYETIRTDFTLDQGVLKSDEFRLEGPMRVFASGSLDFRPDPPVIDAVIGVFLLRQADQLLGKVPIVNWLISDKGLVGAYFALTGPVSDPEVDTLEVKTLAEQTPDVIKAPFRVLRFLLMGRDKTPDQRDRSRR
jgi:uncharacterized protein involved in outer membrane biogenesis